MTLGSITLFLQLIRGPIFCDQCCSHHHLGETVGIPRFSSNVLHSQPSSYHGAICLRADVLLKHTDVIRAVFGLTQDEQIMSDGGREESAVSLGLCSQH